VEQYVVRCLCGYDPDIVAFFLTPTQHQSFVRGRTSSLSNRAAIRDGDGYMSVAQGSSTSSVRW
jgi:hypothetical protein